MFEPETFRLFTCLEHTREGFPIAWVYNPDASGDLFREKREYQTSVGRFFGIPELRMLIKRTILKQR